MGKRLGDSDERAEPDDLWDSEPTEPVGASSEAEIRCALDLAAATWLLEASDLDGAQRVLESALAALPHDVRARSMLAQVLVRKRDFVGASELYERLLSEFRGDLTLTFNLALCHLKSGRHSAAASAFRAILAVRPDHARARAWLRVAEATPSAALTAAVSTARTSVRPSYIDELPRVALPSGAVAEKDATGVVRVRVEEGMRWLVRPDALQGYEGEVTVGSRATEGAAVVTLSGSGTALLRAKETLVVIELRDDEEACVRASSLVAHASSLTAETTDRQVVGEFDEDIVRFSGRGAIILQAHTELVTLPVGLTHATTVRWDDVVGWTGHVIGAPSDSADVSGRTLARFAGNGSLLLSMNEGAAVSPTAQGTEWYGRYQVLRRLEHTEAEEVLLARSHGPGGFQRKVILRRHLTRYEGDSHFLELLAREADAYALLAHPGIVRLYDFLLLDGHPVLVLEYVSGVSLAAMDAALRGQHRTIADPIALYVAHAVFSALAAAHGARDPDTGEVAPILHRDVRPASVLLGWNGDVKLASFATARVTGALAVSADVYVASLLLHGMLTQGAVFDPTLPDLGRRQAAAEPSLESLDSIRPDLSQRLRDALRIALSPDVEGRSLSAADMARAIETAVDLESARKLCIAELGWLRESSFGNMSRSSRPPPPAMGTEDSALFRNLRIPKASPVPHIAPDDSPMAAIAPLAAVAETSTGAIDTPPVPTTRRSLAAPPMLGSDAPSLFQPPSFGPSTSTNRPDAERPRGGRRPWITTVAVGIGASAVAAAVGALAALAPWSGLPGRAGEIPTLDGPDWSGEVAPAATPSAADTAASVPDAPAIATADASANAPAPPATAAIVPADGVLHAPERAARHRIFLDGHAIGEGPGDYRVPCGAHSIRVGSKGEDLRVEIPCGGVLEVE